MQTVLITGGSRGIGAAAVRLFSQNNYNVVFLYKNNSKKALELHSKTGAAHYKCNIADSAEVNARVQEILNSYHRIDVLINNAGVSLSGLFTDTTDEDWKNLSGANIDGPIFVTRAVLPGMISNKKGTIINVSSMWGITGASCEVAYSVSKAAVIGFTKALAKEVGPSNINVNCIAPGAIQTDMMSEYSKEDINAICEETPLMRIGKPEEIAQLMLYLASESASFITGQVISPNGGLVI